MHKEKTLEIIRQAMDYAFIDIEFDESALLIEDLGFDTLDIVEFTMRIERITGKDIPDDVCECWQTIGDVVNYLMQI